ncbi:SDR family oxidoreductase [Nocardiopsis sp. FIRDI 009]|uniref:SDR family oxidoreductase n=1 Tax=Nocardiopsis sp. FIRDI 009 TaxID=714197 RepID=UPI000E265303|nr:SDR family oxidoreductase [Nocardiopsis sp. FIRDI 009]
MGKLTGKTALVTGASRGIGRSIALRLAEDGALVAVNYASNDTAAKEVVEQIAAAGGRAFTVRAELGVPGGVAALWAGFDEGLAAAGERPGLDILVNNAGVTVPEHIQTTEEADFDRLVAVNVKAPFFTVKEGLDRLRDGGRIVNISSGVTRISYPELIAYATTKGALDTFTLALAKELGPRGITVNAVAPGIVDTDVNASWLRGNEEARAGAASLSVLNRVGQPEDIADVVTFLASDDGRWVTGQVVDATGGSAL